MYRHDGADVFVIDNHIHWWDASPENTIHEGGDQFIDTFYNAHTGHTAEERQWDREAFRKYDKERLLTDVFRDGYVDVAMFQPTYLSEFYEDGLNTIERNGELKSAYPERFILNGWFDPRDGEEGLEYLESQKEEWDVDGVKVYTAAWNGDSKGYRLDSEEAFEYLQRCVDLGIENIHAHKGPTLRPLSMDAFDVMDIDDAATSFPELNFIVEHVGLPRLDDFCWLADQEPNVYGGLAVVMPFAYSRPRKFREMMGELLWWLGDDRLIFGSDYAIWEPKWLIEAFMQTAFTRAEREEYDATLDLETKRKILGGNIARLYDIDIEAKKETLSDDKLSREFDSGTDAGVAGD
jgi:predicted TIM-barrel fold metal-dependent hydrolase